MDHDKSPLISVVIPLFKEAANLRPLLSGVTTALTRTGFSFELIVIDDGSPDETWQILSEESKAFPTLHGISLSLNFGKELALCAGLERARGDAVIVMDGDGQHPPELLPEMVRLWQTSRVDIVEAVKSKRGPESFTERFGSLLFYVFLYKLAGVN